MEQKVWAVLPSLWVNWGSRCLGICEKSKSVFFPPAGQLRPISEEIMAADAPEGRWQGGMLLLLLV